MKALQKVSVVICVALFYAIFIWVVVVVARGAPWHQVIIFPIVEASSFIYLGTCTNLYFWIKRVHNIEGQHKFHNSMHTRTIMALRKFHNIKDIVEALNAIVII